MGDPSCKEKQHGSLPEVCRVKSQCIRVDDIARVIEQHYHHDNAAQKGDRVDTFFQPILNAVGIRNEYVRGVQKVWGGSEHVYHIRHGYWFRGEDNERTLILPFSLIETDDPVSAIAQWKAQNDAAAVAQSRMSKLREIERLTAELAKESP